MPAAAPAVPQNIPSSSPATLTSRDQLLQSKVGQAAAAAPWWKKLLKRGDRLSLSQRLFMVQNLSVMVRAGLPLATALASLGKQGSSRSLSRIAESLHSDVEHGKTLTEAMEKFPNVFSTLFTSMVHVGEISGRLEEILDQLYLQLKKDHELVSKVRGAMIYPCVVLVAMGGIAAFMMAFVVPKLTPQFKELGAELPIATQILISISNFMAQHGFAALLIVVAFISSFLWLVRHPLKRPWHAFILRVPVFGKIARKINLGRFTRTLSSLMKTDVPIVQTMRIAGDTLGNQLYRDALRSAADQLKQGVTIHEILEAKPRLFPPLITQMIAVGEETGSLDSVLAEIADFYEQDINQTMKDLPTLIEPILMILMGIGVGGMAVALLLPMYSLTDAIK
jgi:type IV pilus assembly protein PilC